MNFFTCLGLGGVDTAGDGLTVGLCRVLMMTCKEFVASLAAGELRQMRLAEDNALAAAAKQAEKLATNARLAEEKADWAASKKLKRE